jgi:hypothetical protein
MPNTKNAKNAMARAMAVATQLQPLYHLWDL